MGLLGELLRSLLERLASFGDPLQTVKTNALLKIHPFFRQPCSGTTKVYSLSERPPHSLSRDRTAYWTPSMRIAAALGEIPRAKARIGRGIFPADAGPYGTVAGFAGGRLHMIDRGH